VQKGKEREKWREHDSNITIMNDKEISALDPTHMPMEDVTELGETDNKRQDTS
jgi:hypothetical protein